MKSEISICDICGRIMKDGDNRCQIEVYNADGECTLYSDIHEECYNKVIKFMESMKQVEPEDEEKRLLDMA